MARWLMVAVLAAGAVACGDTVPTEGTGSIYEAARLGDMNAVGSLLRTGFDVNRPDDSGMTLLHYATAGNHPQLVEMLLVDFRARTDVTDPDGNTPMAYAQQGGFAEVARLLHEGG